MIQTSNGTIQVLFDTYPGYKRPFRILRPQGSGKVTTAKTLVQTHIPSPFRAIRAFFVSIQTNGKRMILHTCSSVQTTKTFFACFSTEISTAFLSSPRPAFAFPTLLFLSGRNTSHQHMQATSLTETKRTWVNFKP